MKKALGLVASILTMTSVYADANADVFEARACDELGTSLALPVATANEPLLTGDIYFNVRFVTRNANTATDPTANRYSFKADYIAAGSSVYDPILYPLRIGIVVSGKTKWAELVNVRPTPSDYTKGTITANLYDFVFKYHVEPGDFALPIMLAQDINGTPAGTDDSGATYILDPSTAWRWKINYYGLDGVVIDEASLAYNSKPGVKWNDSPDSKTGRQTDYNMSGSGLYARTVNFADYVLPTKGTWATVPESESVYCDLSAVSAVTNTSTFYVWSKDESILQLESGYDGLNYNPATEETFTMYNESGAKYTKKVMVATVKLQEGQSVSHFKVKAMAAAGAATNLVLSAHKGYYWNTSGTGGTLIEDFVEAKMAVTAPPEPYIDFDIEGSDRTVKVPIVGGEDPKSAATLKLKLSRAFTEVSKVYVTVAPETSDLTFQTNQFVRLSQTPEDWNDPENFGPVTFEFDMTGSDLTKSVYVFALGGRDKAGKPEINLPVTSTTQSPIRFRVTDIKPASAKAFYNTVNDGKYLQFEPQAPVITAPVEGGEYSTQGGDTFELSIGAQDNYFNENDTSAGYIIYWYKDTSGGGYDADLAAKRWGLSDGYFCLLNDDGSLDPDVKPSVTYSNTTKESKTLNSSIVIIGPNGTKSASGAASGRKFVVTVAPQPDYTVWAAVADGQENGPTLAEGSEISVQVKMGAAYNEIDPKQKFLYGFLKLEDETLYKKFKNNNNLAVAGARSYLTISASKGATVSGVQKICLDDGSEGGTYFEFDAVLCTSQIYDESKVVSKYESTRELESPYATVTNVRPRVTQVRMNKGAYKTAWNAVTERYEISQPISPEVPVTFDVVGGFSDPSKCDTGATNATERFQTKFWYEETQTEDILYGDPAKTNSTHTFARTYGETCVHVSMMDKDMADDTTGGDGNFGDQFTFWITHTDKPTISVVGKTDDVNTRGKTTFYEDSDDTTVDETPENRSIVVKFSSVPTQKQILWLTVESNDPTSSNPGTFKLQTGTYLKYLSDKSTATKDVYELTVNAGTTESEIVLSTTDGTATSAAGVSVDVTVKTSGTDSGTGKKWADYYNTSAGVFMLKNSAPRLTGSFDYTGDYLRGSCGYQNSEEGAYVVGASQVTTPIKFKVSDIALDLNKNDSASYSVRTNLTVTWSIGGSTQGTTTVTDSTKEFEFYPNFSGMAGKTTLSVTVSDKDGGTTRASWYYDVQASKPLTTIAHGPGASGKTKSNRYSGAGLGKGHTWANQTFSKASAFAISWNCGLNKTANCFAYGYKVKNPKDNGSLDGGCDVAIDKTGANGTGDAKASLTYYDYSAVEPELDSFFYRWLSVVNPLDENNSGSTEEDENFSGISPETPTSSSQLTLSLPSEEDTEGGYGETIVEAVFSKEYLPSDNMGDINHDMIPDVYVQAYLFDVISSSTGAILEDGDDMADLTTYNNESPDSSVTKTDSDDESQTLGDYFPIMDTAGYAGFIPALSNTWVTSEGQPFTAKLEIRGFGDCFNDAVTNPYVKVSSDIRPDQRYTNPSNDTSSTLLPIEWWAFTNFCAKAGLDPTVQANWKAWSPERPTSPVLWDTDGDKLSDGYEYYIWYRAHVGYTDMDGQFKQLQGRKYDPKNPLEPTLISPEAIASAYDPLVAIGGDYATLDTDNDGLPDSVEFLLGTSPFDYDTDCDGLPDGYELYISRTDPLKYATDLATCDGLLNPDGDAMAYYTFGASEMSTDGYWVVPTEIGWLCGPITTPLNMEDDGSGSNTSNLVKTTGMVYTAWVTYSEAADVFRTNGVYYSSKALSNEFARGHVVLTNTYEGVRVTGPKMFMPVQIMHHQVFQEFPYSPFTGWAYLPKGPGYHSRAFTILDEFLTQAFYYHANGLSSEDLVQSKDEPWATLWVKNATNPLKPDTDDDGIPDGWELYVQAGPASGGLPEDDAALVPINGPNSAYGPLVSDSMSDTDQATDQDGLDFRLEFDGVTSCEFYDDAESYTIDGATGEAVGDLQETIFNMTPEWRNKYYPTNPWNDDTDGDGLLDAEEYTGNDSKNPKPFIYGSAGMAGGGLNPLSWDTDADGLPDPFELQFAGTYTATSTSSTTVSTNGTDSASSTNTTTSTTVTWNNDGMDGTVYDARKDYDCDGLDNWQEYLVGAMRCWRYDDPNTAWTAHKVIPIHTIFGDYITVAAKGSDEWNEFWHNLLLDDLNTNGCFNPNLINGYIDPGASFFSSCTNTFDGVYGINYMFADGIYHDLKTHPAKYKGLNRYTWRPGNCDEEGWGLTWSINPMEDADYPHQYICCHPNRADTDYDGMDDYYELFHGMNPMLGAAGVYDRHCEGIDHAFDLIYTAYLLPYNTVPAGDVPTAISACNNWWCNSTVQHRTPTYKSTAAGGYGSGYDFVAHPWLNGMAVADPDGDNLRNQQESILPNVQAAATYTHTDPTPLWMTDTAYSNSLTRLCYRMAQLGSVDESFVSGNTVAIGEDGVPDGDVFTWDGVDYHIGNFPGYTFNMSTGEILHEYTYNYWNVTEGGRYNGWMCDFEENEGYDSDHDYLSDFEEAQGKTKNASEEQDHDDPLRRQAMYFGGEENPSFLQSPVDDGEQVPCDEAACEARQNFLYFTVECWAKPDEGALKQDCGLWTLVERAIYSEASGNADMKLLRKNFLIGAKGGRWYAKFDSTGTDVSQPVEITDGPAVSTNWTHVAATYDGEALKLFINGICRVTKATSLQPEHGVSALAVNAEGAMNPKGGTDFRADTAIAILIGASVKNYRGIIYDYAWRNRNWGYIQDWNPEGLPYYTDGEGNFAKWNETTFDDYDSYYKGYIDEVRIWDGARSLSDIKSDVENRTRYTKTLALENRQAVYSQWKNGALRSPSGNGTLPAQLMYHYAFDHLPGAVQSSDVITVPAGFNTASNVVDAKAMWSRPENWTERCWQSSYVHSRVYNDTRWVPWINNTVSHLPRFDKTTLDSVYWSEDYAGWTSATEYGYEKFDFPRNNEVVSRWSQVTYDYEMYPDENPWILFSQGTRWLMWYFQQQATTSSTNSTSSSSQSADQYKYRFTRRDRHIVGDDMLPMGWAYAKRISATEGGMWDTMAGEANSAADAWAQVGKDSDNNGLPDWWEEYARQKYGKGLSPKTAIDWDTSVKYYGQTMPAWRAYLRDLAKGLVKNGSKIYYDDGMVDNRDTDGDGLPDWWEELYKLDATVADSDEDPDHDGLSNYQEYLLSEIYPDADNGYGLMEDPYNLNDIPMLDPNLDHSGLTQQVPDYFLKYSKDMVDVVSGGQSHFYLNEYFGEIVTDHDFIDDWWENLYDLSYTSAQKYDPLQDADGDGWSNWAECRSALWGASFEASINDKWTGTDSSLYVACRPQPIAGVNVTYYGSQDIGGASLYVRTKTGQTSRMDATFIVPSEIDGQTKYLGGCLSSDAKMHGHLSPGMINVNSVVFYRAVVRSDQVYTWNCDWYQENAPDDTGWDGVAWKDCTRTHTGDVEDYTEEYETWPHIQMEGGDLTWETFCQLEPSTDLSSATLSIDGVTTFGWVDATTGEFELDMSKFSGDYGAEDYVYRVTYTGRVGHSWPQTVYVSDTKELVTEGTTVRGSGYVREGRNTIEAFIDVDGDGAYTVGEPFGSVRNAIIGWHKLPVVTLELKDASPIMTRVALGSTTSSDGTGSSEGEDASSGSDSSNATLEKTVRVTRRLVNGLNINQGKRLTERQLVTKTIVMDDHAYLTEADVINVQRPDLDWTWLAKDAEKFGIENIESVTYSVDEVQDLVDGSTTNITLATFVKKFATARSVASTIAPVEHAPVYSSSPTFTFAASDDNSTGYCLEIRDAATGKTVYRSGPRVLPGRTSNQVGQYVYTVTPPVFADMDVFSSADASVNGSVFSDGSNYQWRVALVNAKFTDKTLEDGDYSDWADFQMDVENTARYPKIATGYGNIEFAVRYYGPTNIAPSDVIVEAFENADFTGQPLAQVRVSGTTVLLASSEDIETANATLRGIQPGRCFFRAYFDQIRNGIRDRWESWGYANEVGSSKKAIYNPKEITITSSAANWQTTGKADYVIYIEDTDYNQNEYPDCVDPYADKSADKPYWEEPEDNNDVVSNPMTDTDGDGMPDLWENWNDGITDPLVADGETLPADQMDAMAYREETWQMVTIAVTNTVDGILVTNAVSYLYDCVNNAKLNSNDGLAPSDYVFTTSYLYGPSTAAGQVYGVGTNLVVKDGVAITAVGDVTVALVHAQVYARRGYNTLTANAAALESGTYDDIDTKAFTALDRYLTMRYFEAIGVTPADQAKGYKSFEIYAMSYKEDGVSSDRIWSQWTLMPGTVDANNDFVADGWQLYVMYGPNLTVGLKMATNDRGYTSPWGAVLATTGQAPDMGGLSWREEYDGGSCSTDPYSVDTDGDNVSDYYAYKYDLKGTNSGNDNDGDGLSNYAEYLITEVFQFAQLDPNNPKTNGSVIDYYRKVGDLYLGEMFTDHDQVDDIWEEAAGDPDVANRYVYDPSKDEDGDGWSNYAEAKAGTNPATSVSPGVDGYVYAEYPVPTIEAEVKYSGMESLSGSLVFQAWGANDSEMTGVPDAIWTASDAALTNANKYVGKNPGTTVTYNLGTGVVTPGSVKLYFMDTAFEKANISGGVELYSFSGEVGNAKWYNFVQDYDGVLLTSVVTNWSASGEITSLQTQVGTIDYNTGKITIDFSNSALQQVIYLTSDNGTSSTTDTDTNEQHVYYNYVKMNFSRSYVRMTWTPAKIATTGNATYYLADATGGKGYIREGLNKFVVFCDSNGDGAYTAGEPFGFVRDVDVGWSGGRFTVELTHTSPIFARINLRGASSGSESSSSSDTSSAYTDREVYQDGNSGVIDISNSKYDDLCKKLGITPYVLDDTGSTTLPDLSSTGLTRIRVMRVMVDGEPTLGYTEDGQAVSVKQVVLDKYLNLNARSYLHEGDFLTAGSYDIDWEGMPKLLNTVVKAKDSDEYIYLDPTNVTYAIVLGEGDVVNSASNTVFRYLVNRGFDCANARKASADKGVVRPVIDTTTPQNYIYGACPTFRFKMVNSYGVAFKSYTAFNLKLSDGTTEYTTGLRDLPALGEDGWYTWTLDEPIGAKFPESGNFKWSVALYNAKYQGPKYQKITTITEWSDEGTFTVDMNTQQPMNDHGYSSIAAVVKYAGPSEVLNKGVVYVQAFETADFAGNPVGQTIVETTSSVSDTGVNTANAVIKGLKQTGTYYLRAFIDLDADGKRSEVESWGAAATPVSISTETLTPPTAGIWIEDTDVDGDWIPDAYEMVVKGNLTELKGEVMDDDEDDKILFTSTLDTYSATAGISTGLSGASLTQFRSSALANTLLGNALTNRVSIGDIRAAVEKKEITPSTLKITALTLAPDGASVTLSIAAEISVTIAGELLGQIYDITPTTDYATVTVKVYKKTSLAESGWEMAGTFENVKVNRTATSVTVDLTDPQTGLSVVDMKSGFYKVEVVQ